MRFCIRCSKLEINDYKALDAISLHSLGHILPLKISALREYPRQTANSSE